MGEGKRRKKLDEPLVRFWVKKKLGWGLKVGCCGRRRVVASDWVGRAGGADLVVVVAWDKAG